MKFSAGQKVRFLDENGEGVIVRMLDSHTAIVAIEHGFEIPYPVSKIVPTDIPEPEKENDKPVSTREAIHQFFYPRPNEKNEDGIYLFYRPSDQNNILSSDLELILVNNYPDDIYAFIYLRDGHYLKSFFIGDVEKKDSVSLGMIHRGLIENYTDLSVQIVFPAAGKKFIPDAFTGDFKIRSVKFFKEGSYEKYSFFDGKVLAVRIFPESVRQDKPPEDFNLSKMILEKEKGLQHVKPLPRRNDKELMEMEVDLHIEELIDNFKGMTNSEIISIQLRFFRQHLEEAIAHNMKKVIFIHGVGNGKLKHEVRRILATYNGIEFFDASYRRYGFGATEVRIR